jgi:hypothetical protein
MTTQWDALKATLAKATEGEWAWTGLHRLLARHPESYSSSNILVVHDDRWQPLEHDAAAIVAALNWLRGGGIAQVEAMREALRKIAAQKLADEMGKVEHNYADFEGGYEEAVKDARAALAATEEAK